LEFSKFSQFALCEVKLAKSKLIAGSLIISAENVFACGDFQSVQLISNFNFNNRVIYTHICFAEFMWRDLISSNESQERKANKRIAKG
jgi:hypothetical protein